MQPLPCSSEEPPVSQGELFSQGRIIGLLTLGARAELGAGDFHEM